jgi:hypothetical protein
VKKKDVTIGFVYTAKVSGALARVKILRENPRGGWDAENVRTGRSVRIRSAQRLKEARALEEIPETPVEERLPVAAPGQVVTLDREAARVCQLCGAKAVVPLTPEQLALTKDDTVAVCHPVLDGCNTGFTVSAEVKEVTREDFDAELGYLVEEKAENQAKNLLSIPGVYEVLAEHFNNEVLRRLGVSADAVLIKKEVSGG